MKFFFAVAALVAPFFAFAAPATDPLAPYIPPSTVSNLNITAYLGRWFQTHTSAIPLLTYEKGAFCVVADYHPEAKYPDVIHLVNSVNADRPGGPLKQITGELFQPNSYKPGKLVVNLDTTAWKTFGLYWIHKLGPIDPDTGLYEWSSEYHNQ
jgi:lipocalin